MIRYERPVATPLAIDHCQLRRHATNSGLHHPLTSHPNRPQFEKQMVDGWQWMARAGKGWHGHWHWTASQSGDGLNQESPPSRMPHAVALALLRTPSTATVSSVNLTTRNLRQSDKRWMMPVVIRKVPVKILEIQGTGRQASLAHASSRRHHNEKKKFQIGHRRCL